MSKVRGKQSPLINNAVDTKAVSELEPDVIDEEEKEEDKSEMQNEIDVINDMLDEQQQSTAKKM